MHWMPKTHCHLQEIIVTNLPYPGQGWKDACGNDVVNESMLENTTGVWFSSCINFKRLRAFLNAPRLSEFTPVLMQIEKLIVPGTGTTAPHRYTSPVFPDSRSSLPPPAVQRLTTSINKSSALLAAPRIALFTYACNIHLVSNHPSFLPLFLTTP